MMTENKRYTWNSKEVVITDNLTGNQFEVIDITEIDVLLALLNEQDERIQELEKVNIQFKGQRDYLLWTMERLLPKEIFEEQKSYLMDINEEVEW